MTEPADVDSIRDGAREAIEEDALGDVLEYATDEDPDQETITALAEVTTDEIVAVVRIATERARRRGRRPAGEDIGAAGDERQRCCCQPRVTTGMEPLFDLEWP